MKEMLSNIIIAALKHLFTWIRRHKTGKHRRTPTEPLRKPTRPSNECSEQIQEPFTNEAAVLAGNQNLPSHAQPDVRALIIDLPEGVDDSPSILREAVPDTPLALENRTAQVPVTIPTSTDTEPVEADRRIMTPDDETHPPSSDKAHHKNLRSPADTASGHYTKTTDSKDNNEIRAAGQALSKVDKASYPRSSGLHQPQPIQKFDFSQHPQIAPEELNKFLHKAETGELDTMTGLTARRLDALLMQALKNIDLIGELPISEAAFGQISDVIRCNFVINHSLNISKVWPALFVTSMVFCARYSRDETRNFWMPYAQLVWGLPQAEINFQNQCREHFETCRMFLEQQYGFTFPLIPGREGSVVRPVVYHAMIPFYLQDDFAKWLAGNLEALCEYDLEHLPAILRDDPNTNRLPPSLRRFIQGEETQEAAAALIIHMADAAKLYLEGEDNVADFLFNPIQRALWNEIEKALAEKVEREHIPRARQPKLTWVWSPQSAALQLRITNILIGPGRNRPDICIWTKTATASLSHSEVHQVLYPLRNYDGRWLIDKVILPIPNEQASGHIYVLSEEHDDESPDVLYSTDVPPLPEEPVLFFQLDRQDLGILQSNSDRIVDGEWLISMAEGVEIIADDRRLEPIESCNVPSILRQYCQHSKAGLYRVQRPLVVKLGTQEILHLDKGQVEIGLPVLKGSLVSGLSSRIPPVFTAQPITLEIPFLRIERLDQIRLSISGSYHSQKVHTLAELQACGVMARLPGGGFTVTLDSLFPNEAGRYSVNLRHGLKPFLEEPLQFVYLPGITLDPPNPDCHYLPPSPPQLRITGVTAGQIDVERGSVQQDKSNDKDLVITWHDLREPECVLYLDINRQSIVLAWPIKRTYAWVDGIAADETLRPKQQEQAQIHVRGEANQRLEWRIADTYQREFWLNSQGQWDQVLGRDQLIDMIKQSPRTHVPVNIAAQGFEWKLFEYVRKPDLQLQHVSYDVNQKRLSLKCQVGHVREGNFRIQLLDPHAPIEEPLVISEFQLLENALSFDCDLPPRSYRIVILSSGEPVDIDPAVANLEVMAPGKPTEIRFETNDLFNLLVLPGARYQSLSAHTGIDPSYKALIHRLAEVNCPDEWIEKNGLLPAWAVLSQPVELVTREHHVRLHVYPELASHKGRAGIGFTALKLSPDNDVRAYVTWEPLSATDYYSALKIGIPEHEVSGPFSHLNELDLWPAYQCALCGRIVGSRSGSYLKLSPSILAAHLHGRGYHDPKDRFRDIVYDYCLHVSVLPLNRTLTYTFLPKQAVEWFSSDSQHSPVSAREHQRANQQWQRAEHQAALQKLIGNSNWQRGFDYLERKLEEIGQRPTLAATGRLLDGIRTVHFSNSSLWLLNRNILLLALLLRSYASATDYKVLQNTSGFTDHDLREIVSLAQQTCPLLLEWAITWVELFRLHACS